MTNTYKLAKSWLYMMIIPAILLFVLFWSLFIFGGGSLDMPFGAWMLLLVVSAVSGGMIYGALTSKLVTSPEGIEHISLGIQVKARWDQVEKIEFAPDGIVNLLFREPIYANQFAKTLLSLYSYNRKIQLSPYISDVATSPLLEDIKQRVLNGNVPALTPQPKHSVRTYQEAGVIGLYFLAWFVIWFLFALALQKRITEYLASLGLFNPDAVLTFIGLSLVAGLFINAIILLRKYNAEIIKLNESGIAHKARTYYVSPLVTILISFLVGMGIRAYLPNQLETYIAFLIGAVSLPVSSAIEKFLFRDRTK